MRIIPTASSAARAYIERLGYELKDVTETFAAVALDDDELVFVQAEAYEEMPEGVESDERKELLERAASEYLGNLPIPHRFDYVAVINLDTGHSIIRHYRGLWR